MTLNDVFRTLSDRDAALVVSDGSLRYVGPEPLAPDDPLRAGVAEHREILVELFTYAPGGRCVADGCYRLKVDGLDVCSDHQLQLDETSAGGTTRIVRRHAE